MKFLKLAFTICAAGLIFQACDITKPVNPNQPGPDSFTENSTNQQLNLLVVGSLSQMRTNYGTYIDAVGIIGREHYRFSGSDPRFVGDLLGAQGGQLDDNAFYTTNPYTARYATIKNTNLIIEGATNTTSNTVSDSDREAYLGFAKTIKAHELLLALNQQFQNGIRVDVDDPDNLGPFLNYENALANLAGLLDEAQTNLLAADSLLPFPLTNGFSDFDTPSATMDRDSFVQLNRSLAARIALYRENYDEAITFAEDSFMDLTGNLETGAYHVFSANSGDQLNPLFLALNSTGDLRTAHPDWLDDAEAGDNRLDNAVARNEPFSNSGLTGTHDVFVYTSNTDAIPFIRNGELVLIYAEAKIQRNQGTDLIDAADALNLVRNEADLPDYSGPITQSDLITEMLKQRRYELWFEGHRWIDARRYDILDDLTIDRAGDIVHEQFPRPFNEKGVQGG